MKEEHRAVLVKQEATFTQSSSSTSTILATVTSELQESQAAYNALMVSYSELQREHRRAAETAVHHEKTTKIQAREVHTTSV